LVDFVWSSDASYNKRKAGGRVRKLVLERHSVGKIDM